MSTSDEITAIKAALGERMSQSTDFLKQFEDQTQALWNAIELLARRLDEQAPAQALVAQAFDEAPASSTPTLATEAFGGVTASQSDLKVTVD